MKKAPTHTKHDYMYAVMFFIYEAGCTSDKQIQKL